jgi:predicted nucleic-acid-binding Zn-ribbon protein
MKTSKRCPKCHSAKVGWVESVLDRAHFNAPISSAAGFTEPRGWMMEQQGVGQLEAYVCATCGYYETYVKDPASVSFDTIKGFRWLNETPGTGQPYR